MKLPLGSFIKLEECDLGEIVDDSLRSVLIYCCAGKIDEAVNGCMDHVDEKQ